MVKDQFHSQFMLKLNEYRDNNNFIDHNHVNSKENRAWPLESFKEFKFLEINASPPWIGPTLYSTRNSTNYEQKIF